MRWSPDGRRLFHFAASQDDSADRWLVEVDVCASETLSLGVPRPLFRLGTPGVARGKYQVGPSGDRFLMQARERGDAPPSRARPELVRGAREASVILKPGARLGPYQMPAPLGAGDMGEVYRARDTKLGRDVALKLLELRTRLRRIASDLRAVYR